ncbi:dipeptide ABC transporter ATP-binding protein [Rouxiella sp. S1S-2]|uniref:dipeptide ABC transporter ATP-binding protein n=1 Tax=Rouxiella sp. S1S-2 TaxID=2653856 RepID=UPI001264DA0E|nr:ABC transporter ATP-binding protein [Rouxiella sp. S1S-2]KAB7897294.1 dipeptide ABC transporter ATP-binding protein [Rouxiella sp. S1S-2]
MPANPPLLSIKGLSVRYRGYGGEVTAVNQVSLSLNAGEIVAVIGESGAGKSAIAQAIPGLLPANADISGKILFQGVDLLDLNHAQLSALRGREIAMIFQDPSSSLDPVFSIGKQLDESIALCEPHLNARQRKSRAVALLSQVGIVQPEKRLKNFPHQFSGGQIQRIMIAMALAGRPKILIADEPTTALDVTTQQEILDLLFSLNQQFGMALLLITHDMGVVADIAQRVIVMRQGKIVENSAAKTLFHTPENAYTRQLLAAIPSSHSALTAVKENFTPLLQVDDVHISYSSGFGKKHTIVNGVSFSVGKGEFLGLLGESGSGKTTLGRSLLGVIKPDRGTLTLAGEPIYQPRSKSIKSRIGAIFQNPLSSLNPRMTLGQSVAEPLQTHSAMNDSQILKRVKSLIDQVGLPAEWHQKYPYELSGGQCQRIAIARAIALNPQLLIADEPTSALDVSIQESILALLRNLQKEYQFACLFISHDLAVVRSLCQSALVLKNGAVVEQGRVFELFSRPASDYTRSLIDSIPAADPLYQEQKRRARAPWLFADNNAVTMR